VVWKNGVEHTNFDLLGVLGTMELLFNVVTVLHRFALHFYLVVLREGLNAGTRISTLITFEILMLSTQ
jgi:hypothetical protein